MSTDDLRSRLNDMAWADLKKTARDDYGLVVSPGLTRDQIIEKVVALSGASVSQVVSDLNSEIKPGFARIRINNFEGAGGKDPVQLTVNNSQFTILRNKVVDIPIKHYQALKNAVQTNQVPDGVTFNENENMTLDGVAEDENPFSFNLLGVNDGPDPRPTPYEKMVQRKLAEKLEFARSIGREWLSNREYAQLRGLPHSGNALAAQARG